MALHFISLQVRWIAMKLYYYEQSWYYTLFPYMSGGFQRNYIITSGHGITLYFFTCQVDDNGSILLPVLVFTTHFLAYQGNCNESIILPIVLVLQCISIHFRLIIMNVFNYEQSQYYNVFPYTQMNCNTSALMQIGVLLQFISLHVDEFQYRYINICRRNCDRFYNIIWTT